MVTPRSSLSAKLTRRPPPPTLSACCRRSLMGTRTSDSCRHSRAPSPIRACDHDQWHYCRWASWRLDRCPSSCRHSSFCGQRGKGTGLSAHHPPSSAPQDCAEGEERALVADGESDGVAAHTLQTPSFSHPSMGGKMHSTLCPRSTSFAPPFTTHFVCDSRVDVGSLTMRVVIGGRTDSPVWALAWPSAPSPSPLGDFGRASPQNQMWGVAMRCTAPF